MKQNWIYKKLKHYISEYSVKNRNDEDIPVYSVTNSQGFCREYFSKEVASKDKTTYKIVPKGFFAYNPSRINVGSIDWQNKEDKVIVSPLYVVFGVSKEISQNYLLYFIKSRNTMAYINTVATGSVRANLKLSMLGDFPIPVPPLADQSRIVAELDLLQSIIDKQKAQLKEYDTLAQSIFYDMFGDPVDNEKGWEMKKLGDCCKSVSYGTSAPSSSQGKFIYLRMNNITYGGELDLTDVKYIDLEPSDFEKYSVREGDILFNRTNSAELVGKTTWFHNHNPMVIAGYIIRVRLDEMLLPTYVSIFMNTKEMKVVLKAMGKGAVNQSNINSKELASIKIPLPPLSLQQKFAEKIEAIEQQKTRISQSIAEAQKLFDYTMDKYFG